tara:strand:- start:5534 stop:5998 length:465 start_codon:yes stop_codon:yes gene_type:complete
MRNTKTARGAIIDMSALAAQHETTRAVSNVAMNARGDRLNQDGSVKVKAEDIAVAHQNMQHPPEQQPISDPKPIEPKIEKPKTKAKKKQQTVSEQLQDDLEPIKQEPLMPNLEEQFSQEPEAISKITRTRDDGTKFVEIEYDDGSIETVELSEE